MFDISENSIELKTIFFSPPSKIPIERLSQIRHILRNFKNDWGIILINAYPAELKQLLDSFPELSFHVEDNQPAKSNTIFVSISKKLN